MAMFPGYEFVTKCETSFHILWPWRTSRHMYRTGVRLCPSLPQALNLHRRLDPLRVRHSQEAVHAAWKLS